MKFSLLAPLASEKRLQLALAAINFFSPFNYEKNCSIVGKEAVVNSTQPFSARDFIEYLEITGTLLEPRRHQANLRHLLNRLVGENILTYFPVFGNDVMLPGSYYCMLELSNIQKRGYYFLTSVLGADFLHSLASSSIVQITGKTIDGDVRAGTGIVLDSSWILTCSHVLKDMRVDERQTYQGREFTIKKELAHQSIDVGIIQVSEPSLITPKGLGYTNPTIGENLYILGFPKTPFVQSAPLIMQNGEVTNSSVRTLQNDEIFLFSATARPGNSGGPIISSSGQLIGIVTSDLTYHESTVIPHYAGVPVSEIQKAISSLEPAIQLPIETYQ